ncbi:spore germination protein [Paenibacillus sp. GCM10023248]|uniref:spore germination protein n=1 Tax=unclassified Paenibacillus TaxID=185978 RepID=UPI002378BF65|nr:spore germination protein [Paenibacillus sp. MAHUQ-63]MDD9265605.1 spore germination protein [Paenibacillus sp. MAHUQ-63]
MAKEILKRLMFNAGVKTCNTIGDGIAAVLSGDTLVVIEGIEQANLVSSKGFKDRGVEEPATENNVRGPRDGFTESLRTNTALVRRRIKDPMLRLDAMVIGTRSKTDINIAYIQDLVKEGLVEVVKQRLGRIKIDAILESGYIEELIEDAPAKAGIVKEQKPTRRGHASRFIMAGCRGVFIQLSSPVMSTKD